MLGLENAKLELEKEKAALIGVYNELKAHHHAIREEHATLTVMAKARVSLFRKMYSFLLTQSFNQDLRARSLRKGPLLHLQSKVYMRG